MSSPSQPTPPPGMTAGLPPGPPLGNVPAPSGATPLTLRTILIVWGVALIFSQLLNFLRAWVISHLEARLLRSLQQRIYDHLQSLSLDFFTGGQTGALMQRVLSEATGVQRLLTQVLLYPLIDVLVLVVVFTYLFALSWQMTLVSFVLAPLALVM